MFASWTLIAYAGMATQARVSVLFPVWLATVPIAVALLVVVAHRSRRAATSGADPAPGVTTPLLLGRARALAIAGVAAGAASALLAASERVAWPIVWVPALLSVVAALAAGRLRTQSLPRQAASEPTWAHIAAAAAGVGFATMSLFLSRPNGDDVFYVNRATATAQLDRIPVFDVIFTAERVGRAGGTGVPLEAFAALQGAAARFADLHAASVAYYVTPPLMTFFATWALWRLVREWAPRVVILCFGLGCVFWLWSAQFDLSPGNFFATRMWQGKVVFAAWLVPTLYVYLTRWVARSDARTALLLLAGAVAAIGMTGSAAFVVPLVFGAAALPLLARGEWRRVLFLVAAAAIPAVAGLVASRGVPLPSRFPAGHATDWYYHAVFGVGGVAVVAALAVWSAPWLARRGPAASITTAIAAVTALLLAPSALDALNEALGLGGTRTLRRVFWAVPFPAVVGLLAAVPVRAVAAHVAQRVTVPRRLSRLAAVVPAAIVAAVLVAVGDPLWRWEHGTYWTSRPTWKTGATGLHVARAILARYDGPGPILAERPVMKAITILTVQPKTVNPRHWYARLTLEPPRTTRQRGTLFHLVTDGEPQPSPRKIRRALTGLRVGLVCIDGSNAALIRQIDEAGYRAAFWAHTHVCLEPPPLDRP